MGWGCEEESMDMAYPAGVRTMPALTFPGLLEYCTSWGPASSAQLAPASYAGGPFVVQLCHAEFTIISCLTRKLTKHQVNLQIDLQDSVS